MQSSRLCFKAHTDLNVTLNPVGDDLFRIFRVSFTHSSCVSLSSSSCNSKLVNIVQICPHTTRVLVACRRRNFKADVSNRLVNTKYIWNSWKVKGSVNTYKSGHYLLNAFLCEYLVDSSLSTGTIVEHLMRTPMPPYASIKRTQP